MQRLLFKFLAPALFFAVAMISELPASTFGGSTGPRQSTDDDQNLPRVQVDGNTYRRTKARLSIEDVAPLYLPAGSFVVRKAEEDIVEFNKTFLLVPRD
jgi:hypothetical protein